MTIAVLPTITAAAAASASATTATAPVLNTFIRHNQQTLKDEKVTK